MKYLLTNFILLSFICTGSSGQVNEEFFNFYGPASGSVSGYDVVQTNDSNFLIGGYQKAQNAETGQFYLLKINSRDGSKIWDKSYSHAYFPQSGSLGLTKFNKGKKSILAGAFKPEQDSFANAYLLATDQTGDSLWSYQLDSKANSAFFDVKSDYQEKSIIAAGFAKSEKGHWYPLISKLGYNGSVKWQKAYADTGVVINSITKAHDSGWVMTGFRLTNKNNGPLNFITMKIKPDGEQAWFVEKRFSRGQKIIKGYKSNYVITGTFAESRTSVTPFINKVEENGLLSRKKTIPEQTAADVNRAITRAGDSGFMYAGHAIKNGKDVIALHHFSNNGGQIWSKYFKQSLENPQIGELITINKNMYLAVGGGFKNRLKHKLMVLKFNTKGAFPQYSGIKEENTKEKAIKLFPNPFHNLINVKIESNPQESLKLHIYGVTGKRDLLTTTELTEGTLRLNDLKPGFYFYQIKGNGGQVKQTGKLVKSGH